MLETLLDMVALDFVGLRVDGAEDTLIRVAPESGDAGSPEDLRAVLEAQPPANGVSETTITVGGDPISVIRCPLVGSSDRGLILAGARRETFPDRSELATIRLIVSQAALALRGPDARPGAHDALRDSEAALRESERELQQIVASIPGLTWRADAQGNITYWSRGFMEFADATLDEVIGYGFLNYIHPDDRDQVMDVWVRILQSGRPGESETRLRRADGQYRWFLWRVSPFFDDAGEITQWFGINVDIEDRKRAEEDLRRSQDDLAHMTRMTTMGELAVSIAHEVNQPLMAVVTNAGACLRWLSAPEPDIAKARQAAERIVRDGHRAGDIITSLRNLARKSAPRLERLRLDQVIPVVLDLLQGELRRHGVVAKVQLGQSSIAIRGDGVQLQQVLLNLVMNAVEAMAGATSGSRRLTVRAQIRDGEALVSVADTGPGLGAENPERLFEAFVSTKTEGIGMGLSICRSIIEAHGGRIWATGNGARGSVFSFSLPLAEGSDADVVIH